MFSPDWHIFLITFFTIFYIFILWRWVQSKRNKTVQGYLLAAKKETQEISQIALKTPYPLMQVSEGRIIFINPSALAAFPDIQKKGIEHQVLKGIEDISFNGQSISREIFLNHSVFDQTICRSTMAGKEALIIYCYDITQRKDYERKLEHAYKETYTARIAAEKAKQARGDFLANMSHELRTPMNGIIGLSDILSSSDLSGEKRKLAEAINNSARNLLNVLNDILDFSKIEAGEMKIENISFNIRDVIRQVFGLHSFLAEQKGLETSVDIATDVPDYVISDPSRLQQILNNLIGNAVKFTPYGSITLAVEGEYDGKGEFFLCLKVEDTGIGIPVDKQKNIFSKFEQVDASISRKYGGTGLGLTITKNLIALLNGSILMESEENRGTVFTVRIPVEISAVQSTTDSEEEKASLEHINLNSKILIVDDHPINLLYLDKALTGLGFKNFDKAHNGQKALELFNENQYDLILMDCQMPEIDGYEVTKHIRANEKNAHRTIVIAVTANAMKGAEDDCRDAGMDDYISKPIDKKKLAVMLQRWLPADMSGERQVIYEDFSEKYNDKKIFNWDRLNHFTDGDNAVISKTIKIFTDNLKIDLQQLEHSYLKKDYKEWEKIAHKLCGSCANVGADILAEKCEKAQQVSLEDNKKIAEYHQIIMQESKKVENLLASYY